MVEETVQDGSSDDVVARPASIARDTKIKPKRVAELDAVITKDERRDAASAFGKRTVMAVAMHARMTVAGMTTV